MLQFTINDTALIPALHKGEQQAFAVIFHHFAGPVRLFLEDMVGDRQAAEDLTAEAFLRTFRKHKDFPSLEKLKAFIYIVASNGALDFLKKEKRHERVHQAIRYGSEEKMDDLELAFIQAESIRAIHQAIETLPAQSRRVIRMEFVEGKTLGEIAEALNIAYKTVQHHKTRGLELLRIRLVENKLLSPAILAWALAQLTPQ